MPEVIAALPQHIPDKEALLRVLNRLHDQLANNAAPYRKFRDSENPDFLFDYVHALHVGDRWVTLRFSVNNTTAAGYLFVEAVVCR